MSLFELLKLAVEPGVQAVPPIPSLIDVLKLANQPGVQAAPLVLVVIVLWQVQRGLQEFKAKINEIVRDINSELKHLRQDLDRNIKLVESLAARQREARVDDRLEALES